MMRGFNALHLHNPYRALSWLTPVADKVEEPFHGQCYINLCRAYAELNRFEEAVQAGVKATRIAPARVNAHLNLAVALAFGNRFEEALDAMNPLCQAGQICIAEGFLKWIGQCTDKVQTILVQWLEEKGYSQLSRSVSKLTTGIHTPWTGPNPKLEKQAFDQAHKIFQTGDITAARKGFLNALKQNPTSINSKLALTQISRMQTDYSSSLMELDQIETEHSPLQGSSKGHVLAEKARNLTAMELFADALTYAEKSVKLLPEDDDVLNLLGFCQFQIRDFKRSEKNLKKALRYNPEHHLAMNNLARLYLEREDDQGAIALYLERLQKMPDDVSALVGLAHVYQVQGDLAAVQKYLQKAIQIDPIEPTVIRLAAKIDPTIVDDNMLKKLSETGDRIRTDVSYPPNKSVKNVQLLFALSDLFDKRKEFEMAEKYLFAANKIQNRLRPYRPDQHKKLKDSLVQLFNSIDAGKIIKRGQKHFSRPRPIFILGMPRSGSTLLDRILSSHSSVASGGEMKELRVELETIEAFRQMRVQGNQWLHFAINGLYKEDVDDAAKRYRKALQRVDSDANYVIDKMPGNFWWIGFIIRMIPDAVILHTCRDMKSTCLSCFQQYFSDGQAFSFTPKGIAHYYSLYSSMMNYWHEKFPGRILDVRYETLVKDMDLEVNRVLSYCSLDWQPEMARFYEQNGLVKTASLRQVRKPLYSSALDRWKNFPMFLETLGDLVEYKPVV
jgi:Tfp pilus assembly protein PilF